MMHSEEDIINLTEENKSLYGFSSFHFSGEENITNETWIREINIEVSGSHENKTRISIPQQDLICLSNDKTQKVNSWQNFSVQSIGNSTEAMFLLSKRIGWNQTKTDINKFISKDSEGNFLAVIERDNSAISLGSGLLFPVNDGLSWIGMILVHPELRRQGIANSIMEHCIEYARLKKKSKIIGLDATPMGMKVYTFLGFKESYRIWRCLADTKESMSEISPYIKPLLSFESLKEYTERRKISDKLSLLEMLYTSNEERCFKYVQENRVQGFIMSRPGRLKPYIGPLVADTDEIAHGLLKKVLEYWKDQNYRQVFIDVPRNHFKISSELDMMKQEGERLLEHSFSKSIRPVRELIRMYQCVSSEDHRSIIAGMETNKSSSEKIARWEKILTEAEKYFEETSVYMQFEKEVLIPNVYAIGGPEIS